MLKITVFHRASLIARLPARAVCLRSAKVSDFSTTNKTVTAYILGDLHLGNPSEQELFESAREQINNLIEEDANGTVRLVQLGDLGSSKIGPGSKACFDAAHSFLSGFKCDHLIITGNHDLEGLNDFATDAENLAYWRQKFGQPHYWSAEVGPAVFIGMSTVRFRSNPYSVHEVHIDKEQLQWFDDTLTKYKDRPVFVFTHAPPIGSGLKVIQELHVKNRCCWLNHTERPEIFRELIKKHGNVRAWMSGHFHLSHNYLDSISVVDNCAFVQTGVIGRCGRDGERHSRVIQLSPEGFEVGTLDHETGQLRSDLRSLWSEATPQVITPEDELLCDPEKGWLCSRDMTCPIGIDMPGVEWIATGPNSMLAVEDNLIAEYNVDMQAPIGVVTLERRGREARLIDASGAEVCSETEDGSRGVALELRDADGSVEVIKRNQWGGFWKIYQPNKVLKKAQEAAAAAAAAAAAI